MGHPIVKTYETAQQASDAVKALKANGLEDELINVVAPSWDSSAHAPTVDAVAAAIAKGYVLMADARLYARTVIERGFSLVSVRPPFGWGRMVTDILQDFSPIDSGVKEAPTHAPWEDAAPFSSTFGWSLLSNPDVGNISFGLPLLSSSKMGDSSFGIPLLSNPLLGRSSFGLPLLSKKAAPFSSLLGLPLLTSR